MQTPYHISYRIVLAAAAAAAAAAAVVVVVVTATTCMNWLLHLIACKTLLEPHCHFCEAYIV